MNNPNKADPEHAAQINRRKPLNGAFVSRSNFFFNSGSIFDINDFIHKLKFILKKTFEHCRYSSVVEQLFRKQWVIGSNPIIGIFYLKIYL